MIDSLFAIGIPGQRVRLFIQASAENIVNQLGEDEWAIEVDEAFPSMIRLDCSGIDRIMPTMDEEREKIRVERWGRLVESDWTQVGDAPISDALKAQWRAYRQALRDILVSQPDATSATVEWPSKPAS